MSLDFRVTAFPYSTAITDSLNSQVATAPLRIQFAGVTPVPLPPRRGKSALCLRFISYAAGSISEISHARSAS
jgi:hypothetical protein